MSLRNPFAIEKSPLLRVSSPLRNSWSEFDDFQPDTPPHGHDESFWQKRGRPVFSVVLVLVCFGLIVLTLSTMVLPPFPVTAVSAYVKAYVDSHRYNLEVEQFNKSLILLGDGPSPWLRGRWAPDVMYITTLPYGGLSNQMMCIEHLLMLAKLLNYAAVLPAFVAVGSHTPGAGALLTSELFDLDFLYTKLQLPYVEWHDLKPQGGAGEDVGLPEPQFQDLVGCFSLHWEMYGDYMDPAAALYYGTAVSYWPMVTKARREARGGISNFRGDAPYHEGIAAWAMDKQGIVNAVEEEFAARIESSMSGEYTQRPDGNFLCIDNLFFADVLGRDANIPSQRDRYQTKGNRSWLEVGRHMHWTSYWEDLGAAYLRMLFNLDERASIPPFLGMHLRRGDFAWARSLTAIDHYVEALGQLRADLKASERPVPKWQREMAEQPRRPGYTDWFVTRRDPKQLPVVVTTDETDPDFLADLRQQGWIVVDHVALDTYDRFGPWASSVLDAVMLSRAIGVVGTPHSTFSYLAMQRVMTWNGGVGVEAIEGE